ncbi:MAG: hypothetical protein JXN59_02055 [Anaerolineae bacterium]|nr:hypothetical protein [Anaerolineae bacterium]
MYANPQLALLVDYAYEPLILLDDTLRVIAANQVARDLLPETAIAGVQIQNLFDSPELEDLLNCALEMPNCPESQMRFRGRYFRARCTRFTVEDQGYLALGMQDITHLLRLTRARRDMVANISHELRTPISAIRLLRDTLSRQNVSTKQQQKMLRKIGRELDTLQRIVDGMHDLSMIESGQSIMKLIEMPLVILVNEALEHLDEQIEARKVRISTSVPDDLRALVDPGQIGRVLANLIHNALKVTPKKGRIRVSAELTMPGDAITVYIEDSGPGIPADERDRIFERFYQLDESRTARLGGSGLGLSIARHIVEAHQGKIWVEASELGGARFCFTLLAAE